MNRRTSVQKLADGLWNRNIPKGQGPPKNPEALWRVFCSLGDGNPTAAILRLAADPPPIKAEEGEASLPPAAVEKGKPHSKQLLTKGKPLSNNQPPVHQGQCQSQCQFRVRRSPPHQILENNRRQKRPRSHTRRLLVSVIRDWLPPKPCHTKRLLVRQIRVWLLLILVCPKPGKHLRKPPRPPHQSNYPGPLHQCHCTRFRQFVFALCPWVSWNWKENSKTSSAMGFQNTSGPSAGSCIGKVTNMCIKRT